MPLRAPCCRRVVEDARFDGVIIIAIIVSSICLALDVPRLDPTSTLAIFLHKLDYTGKDESVVYAPDNKIVCSVKSRYGDELEDELARAGIRGEARLDCSSRSWMSAASTW